MTTICGHYNRSVAYRTASGAWGLPAMGDAKQQACGSWVLVLQMVPVSRAVHIGLVESLGIMQQGKTFEDFPHLAQAANRLLDDMSWWAKVLKPAREGMT
jgi:hypothetical protein